MSDGAAGRYNKYIFVVDICHCYISFRSGDSWFSTRSAVSRFTVWLSLHPIQLYPAVRSVLNS